jgi:hypothetical protein
MEDVAGEGDRPQGVRGHGVDDLHVLDAVSAKDGSKACTK